ncbi:MAG: hypothetical protein ACRC62_21615 [Microcoleus sp.]
MLLRSKANCSPRKDPYRVAIARTVIDSSGQIFQGTIVKIIS